MPLLEIKNVTHRYDGHHETLANVSIQANEGEAVGIVGGSGAGKSTLAAVASGLLRPASGEVLIQGTAAYPPSGRNRQVHAWVQLIWQDAAGSLDPRMKAAAAIAEPLLIHGLAKSGRERAAVDELLAEVGLASEIGNRYPRQLSGGEAQRVAIARALALSPRLLICDEPASALDAALKSRLVELLLSIRRRRGLAYLLIGHDLPLALRLTEKIFVMYKGHVVESGPTRSVLASPLHPYTAMLVDSDPLLGRWEDTERQIAPADNQPQARAVSGCPFAAECITWSAGQCAGGLKLMPAGPAGRKVACRRPLNRPQSVTPV